MMTFFCSRSFLNLNLSRAVIVGALTTMGLLSGLVPNLSASSPNIVFGSSASAQSSAVSESEVTNYATIVMTVEPARQAAYGTIKKRNGGNVPPIVCNDQQSLARLNPNIRNVATNFCNQYTQIVKRNGMTITRFNEITVMQQADPDLQNRIKNALLRLAKKK